MSSAEKLNQGDVLARNPGADSPFGKHRGNRSRWLAMVAFAVSLGITAFLVARYRGGRDVAHTAKQSQVTTVSASTDGPQPIMLQHKGEQRIGVTFAAATMGPLSREVRSAAQVTFDETRVKTIAPKVDGWVEQLYVNYVGQSLHVGDPLLSIYSPMLVSAQQDLLLSRHLRTEMVNATPEAREAAANLEESARRRLLYWDVSVADVDRLLATGEVRKALTLRSPASGVVLEKAVLGGQKVVAGEALYKVADLSVVWLEGEVFERDLPLVRLGETVSADFDALPGSERSGRISYIYPTVNTETRTIRIRVALPNPGLALKPGMYATIRITGGGGKAVLIVPRSSVLSTGERNLVFVKRSDGMLEPHPVVLGISNDEQIQILSGLSAGDTVVASATFLVDAESNLGSVLGGMGNMPGMDITKPVTDSGAAGAAARPVAPAPRTRPPERR